MSDATIGTPEQMRDPDYMPEYREAVEKAKKLLKTNF